MTIPFYVFYSSTIFFEIHDVCYLILSEKDRNIKLEAANLTGPRLKCLYSYPIIVDR